MIDEKMGKGAVQDVAQPVVCSRFGQPWLLCWHRQMCLGEPISAG